MFRTLVSLVSLHCLVEMKTERHTWNCDRLRIFAKCSFHSKDTFRLIWWGCSSLNHLIESMSKNVQVKLRWLHSTVTFFSLCLERTFCSARSLPRDHHGERIREKSSKISDDLVGADRRTFEKCWRSDSFGSPSPIEADEFSGTFVHRTPGNPVSSLWFSVPLWCAKSTLKGSSRNI